MDQKKNSISRRQFVEFFGGSSLYLLGRSLLPATGMLMGAAGCSTPVASELARVRIPVILPSAKDDLVLAEGLEYSILVKWGDVINEKGDRFGFNNDYIAFIPLDGDDNSALLWVNHEYHNPIFIGGWERGQSKSKSQVEKEMYEVGGSILKIKRGGRDAPWELDRSDARNRRLTGNTPIPLVGFKGEKLVETLGTMGNCAGGVTPWKTILTCEENYDMFYGEVDFFTKQRTPGAHDWEKYFPRSVEDYGWVVEIDPQTGAAKKLLSLGRFAHESATTTRAKDGRVVVYSGDDKAGECLYKFISRTTDSLLDGELFVADVEKGQWVSLDRNKHQVLKNKFKDQREVLTFCRVAAHLVGGTALDRPEDVEVHPETGHVYVSLSNNVPKGNYFGQIFKLEETDQDAGSLTFKSGTFVLGGDQSGFACPDNMGFDRKNNLWMSTDMSGTATNKPPYEKFKNNGLFYFPLSGPQAGVPHQLGSGPVEAELTGIQFDRDGKSLFLSVQHPGEYSPSVKKLTSSWPAGGGEWPRPALVQIRGKTLDDLTGA